MVGLGESNCRQPIELATLRLLRLVDEGNEPPSVQNLPKRRAHDEVEWGSNGKERRMLGQFCRALSKADDKCQKTSYGSNYLSFEVA